MILSIHQPNFFPWLGFFNKLYSSDEFIFLTDSIRSKNDKYLTRSYILNNASRTYLSMPIGPKQIKICDLLMPNNARWRINMLNLLNASYSESEFYDEILTDLESLLMYDCDNFSEFSINIIYFLMKKLQINTNCYIDKNFNKDFGVSTLRLVNLCNEVDADKYLSGIGAKSYIDEEIFLKNRIDVMFQDYLPRDYKQISNEFKPGLSIIDALFNCGYYETEQMIKNPL
jgi:hypothetical protein